MPELLSAAFCEREGAVLTAHRKTGRAPFAGQWLLPLTRVSRDETAEEAAGRHVREQFGASVAAEVFVDTVYMQDPDDQRRYVTNVFRTDIGDAPLRFRADGDYDDARWLNATELASVWMPPDLRDPIVRILTEPAEADVAPDLDAGALPLAERAVAEDDQPPPPDNASAWEKIAPAYQRQHAGYDGRRLRWASGVYEDGVGVLGSIAGQHAIVLGSGDGRDVVALACMGAIAVGVDASPRQVAAAKKLAAKERADNASFVEARVEDLTRFDDASFDLAVSISTFDFVDRIDDALSEAARVLRPGGTLAFAVQHPFDAAVIAGSPPLRVASYWRDYVDWNWDADGTPVRLRSYTRTLSDWTDALDCAGFALERLLEPRPHAADEGTDESRARAAIVPAVLIIKARKR